MSGKLGKYQRDFAPENSFRKNFIFLNFVRNLIVIRFICTMCKIL